MTTVNSGAACLDYPSEMFVPLGLPSRPHKHATFLEKEAVKVCEECKIRKECLAIATKEGTYKDFVGVWGGMIDRERYELVGAQIRLRSL